MGPKPICGVRPEYRSCQKLKRIPITQDLSEIRAGKARWEWLAQVLQSQGYSCEKIVGNIPGARLGFLQINLPSTPKDTNRWELRLPGPSDEMACLSLFEQVFGTPGSAELWRWKYAEGRGRSIVALRGNRVIAHYGGVSRLISRCGHIERVIQISDVMVNPAERAVMTRSGVFLQMARASQEFFLGFEAHHDFGFGFPNKRHMQLAHRLGLYDEVEQLVEIEWEIGAHSRSWTTKADVLGNNNLDPRVLDELWRQMQEAMRDRILVTRDSSYWLYRYPGNPHHHYRMLAVRRRVSGRLLGVVVLRREETEAKLLDVLGMPQYFPLLVRHAIEQVRDWQLPILRAWITHGCAGMFLAFGARCKPTDIVIPLNAHCKMHATPEISNRWFLMMGDTDFL